MDFYKALSKYCKKIEIQQDPLLNLSYNLRFLYLIKYFIDLILLYFKERQTHHNSLIPFNGLNDKPKIVFIYSSKNQFDSIKPLIDYFYKKRIINPFQYRDISYLEFKKIPEFFKLYYFYMKNWNEKILKITRDLNKRSFSFANLMADFFQYELILRILRLNNNLNHLKKFFKNIRPSLVIFADEMRAETRLYSSYCKYRKISSIYITHGSIPIWPELIFPSDFKFIAAPGEFSKNYLINKGENDNKIIITGRPKYEKFYKGEIKPLKVIEDLYNGKRFFFDSNKFVILFATSPVDYISRKIIFETVIGAIKKLDLINNLIVKLHPREDGKLYLKILKKMNIRPIMVRDYDLFELMVSSNLYLSRTSATILEAMIVGIPIILLDFVNLSSLYTGMYQFCEEEYLIKVKNEEMLIREIKRLINDSDFYKKYSSGLKKLARKFSFFDDKESATNKIISLINNTIKNKR
ncbi:MAG: hypothetical protein ACTSUG_11390 [Candidatus Helarchaeota archaeon]